MKDDLTNKRKAAEDLGLPGPEAAPPAEEQKADKKAKEEDEEVHLFPFLAKDDISKFSRELTSKSCIQFNQMEADAESIEAKMLISAKLLERMVSCHSWVELPQLRKRIFYIDNLVTSCHAVLCFFFC